MEGIRRLSRFDGFTGFAGFVVGLLLMAGSASLVAKEQRPRNAPAQRPNERFVEGWDHFSVDVSIRHVRVDGDGKPSGPTAPDTTFRWERQQKGGGWTTTMTILASRSPVAQSIDGPRELEASDRGVVRIEDDEDGTPLRFSDARGRKIDVPGFDALARSDQFGAVVRTELEALKALAPIPRPLTAGRDWIDGLVVQKAKNDARKKSIEGRFGRVRGEVRGLDQFLTAGPEGQHELLVDRAFQVPIEINVTKDGVLVSHTRIAYEPGAPGAPGAEDTLIRRSVRIEEATPAGSDGKSERRVAEIQFTNLRLQRKGGSR